jgi:thiosulfate/3-mercaptopyruvate sulfurtransferase
MDSLVTTEWLANELGANDLRIVDATYILDGSRDAAAEYEAAHIPGAVFMDLAEIADTSSTLPSMLPRPEKFASRMQSLGLGDGSRIVLYDNSPLRTAARAWFMLRTFGAHDVAILDGGFAKWQAEGRETVSGKEQLRHRHFTVWADDKGVRTLDQMKANIDSGAEQVLDARSAARRHVENRRHVEGRVRRRCRRSVQATRYHLRLGHHRVGPGVRRASARQRSRRL